MTIQRPVYDRARKAQVLSPCRYGEPWDIRASATGANGVSQGFSLLDSEFDNFFLLWWNVAMRHTQRDEHIHIRVSLQEKQHMLAQAQRLGLNLSDYLRMLGLGYEVRIEQVDEDTKRV